MMGVIEGDRFCRPLPLYHVGGMVLGSVLGIVHGVTVVYLGEAFDPPVALESLQNECCTLFVGVPTMFVAILNHPEFLANDATHEFRWARRTNNKTQAQVRQVVLRGRRVVIDTKFT